MAKTTEVTIPNPTKMRTEIKELMSDREALEADTLNIVIIDNASKIVATEMLMSRLVPLQKLIIAKRQQYSLTLRRLATAWDEEFKPLLEWVVPLIDYLKNGITEFTVQEEAKVAKLQAELDRKAREEEETRLKAVAEAEAKGEPVEEQQIPETIVAIAPEVKRSTEVSGGTATIKKTPVLEIYDESLLPREYLIPDKVLIFERLKMKIPVSGARIVLRNDMAIRLK